LNITPQILRVWFSNEMRIRGIDSSYVDIFQGRAPRSVIEKHYTPRAMEFLRRIYDQAGLKVLT